MTQPTSVGPYEILEELGRGTTGIIYKARHPIERHRFVALKTPCIVPESEARWRATCFRGECDSGGEHQDLHRAPVAVIGKGVHVSARLRDDRVVGYANRGHGDFPGRERPVVVRY
jgi:hypothetical protein